MHLCRGQIHVWLWGASSMLHSDETCIALFILLASLFSSSATAAESSCLCCITASWLSSALASWWCVIKDETRGAVMLYEDWWWDVLFLVRLLIHRAPCHTGRAIKTLVLLLSALSPFRDGRNLCFIAYFSG